MVEKNIRVRCVKYRFISNVESRKVLKERTEEDGRKTFHLLYICPINEPQVVERAALYQYT